MFSGWTIWAKGFGSAAFGACAGAGGELGCDSCSEGFGLELFSGGAAGTVDGVEDEAEPPFAAGWPPSFARRFMRILSASDIESAMVEAVAATRTRY